MKALISNLQNEAVVEEDANVAELDNTGQDEMQEVDVGEESYGAGEQIKDVTIASPDEVAEAEDEDEGKQ